ncbi:MAG: hypothetical protein EHM19_06750, partial [Candidatus Latescibacterota bacterium]
MALRPNSSPVDLDQVADRREDEERKSEGEDQPERSFAVAESQPFGRRFDARVEEGRILEENEKEKVRRDSGDEEASSPRAGGRLDPEARAVVEQGGGEEDREVRRDEREIEARARDEEPSPPESRREKAVHDGDRREEREERERSESHGGPPHRDGSARRVADCTIGGGALGRFDAGGGAGRPPPARRRPPVSLVPPADAAYPWRRTRRSLDERAASFGGALRRPLRVFVVSGAIRAGARQGGVMSRNAVAVLALSCALALSVLPAPRAAAEPYAPDANHTREMIPGLYKWDLSPILAGDSSFDPALEEAIALRKRLGAFQGRLADPAALRECLDFYFRTRLATNKLTLYANLRFDSHLKSPELQAMNDRALQAMNDLMAEASFIRREILTLDDAAVKAAFAREKGLEEYRVYLDEIRRRRDRVLEPEAERILSLAGDNLWAEIDLNELPSDHEKTHEAMLSDMRLPAIADEKGGEVQLTFSNYPRYRRSADRNVRREAVEGVFATLRDHQHVLAATMAGQINTSIFFARSRGYDSALHAYLDMENIDPAVYRNLIAAVRANLAPLHRYVELRKKLMALDEVRVYDLYTPL